MSKKLLSIGKSVSLVAVVVGAMAMTGCAHRPNNAQIGTGVGAVAGGVVGNAVFGGPVGTIGGAAAGALIGNHIGERNDGYHRSYRR